MLFYNTYSLLVMSVEMMMNIYLQCPTVPVKY